MHWRVPRIYLSFGNNKLVCRKYHTAAIFYSYLLYAALLQLPFNQSCTHTLIHAICKFPSTTRALTALLLCYDTGALLFFLRSAYSSRCTAPHFPSTRLTRMQGVLHFTLLHTHLLLFFRFIFSCALMLCWYSSALWLFFSARWSHCLMFVMLLRMNAWTRSGAWVQRLVFSVFVFIWLFPSGRIALDLSSSCLEPHWNYGR